MESGIETNSSDSTEGSTPIVRANPFLRFAFTSPDTEVSNLVQGCWVSLKRTIPRSPQTPLWENESNVTICLQMQTPITERRKGYRSQVISVTLYPVPFSLPYPGSKRVKVYDHLQEIGDNLAPGLDSEHHSWFSSWRALTYGVVMFCGIKYCNSSGI